MKIYLVQSIDTNEVVSVDKVFLRRQDAEDYIDMAQGKVGYFVKEQTIMVESSYYYSSAF